MCDSTAVALSEWLDDGTSNLAIVAGPFGAGKSTHMADLAAISAERGLATTLIDFARDGGIPDGDGVSLTGDVLFVDHFDALNLATGVQREPPDLRAIRDLLKERFTKVIVATRRPLADAADGLVHQLSSRRRCQDLGVRKPLQVELLPWSMERVTAFARQSDDPRMEHVRSFLAASGSHQGEDLRRPLLLSMLLDVIDRMPSAASSPELGDLYDAYVDYALARDFDHGNSQLDGQQKHGILRELAYDIFTGQEAREYSLGTQVTLSYERVSGRVMEATYQRLMSLPEGYSLVHDFVATNHLFSETPRTQPYDTGTAEFGFLHPTFYDYFVGQAMAARYARGQSLSIREDTFSPATLDSLAMYFAKRQLSDDARKAMRRAAMWDGLNGLIGCCSFTTWRTRAASPRS